MAKTSGADIVELPRGINASRYTVNNNNAITKGDLLFLVDPKTVSGANLAAGNAVAGVAAEDKEVADGKTDIGVWQAGVFDVVVGIGGCNIGAMLKVSGGNYVVTGTADDFMSGAAVFKALETGSVNEKILVKLGLF